ncbi:hypothetical protein CSUI_004349 [Cystoisospora suis]|uniref:Uncharacterized protein n=1 Tax=Cystoisospora suis TaxID=483139 RepID=A0A2C6KMU8_9APIC|nr:hypothetical protein CSUI_004349 [Cystoisospora suis]
MSILALVAPGKRHNKEASRSNVSSSSSSSSLPALLPSPTLTPSRIPPDQRSRLGQDSADGGDMSPASLSLTNSGNVERSGFKEGRAKKDFLQENDHRREEDEEDLPVPGNAVTSTTATTATTAFCVEGGGGGGGSQYKTKTSISILSLLENRILRSKQGEEDLSQCQISEGEKNQREEEEERERRERNEASGHARHARRLGSEGRGGATSGEGEDREGRKEERKHPDRKTYRDKGGGTALLDMLKRRATPADGDLFKTATGDASQISSHCHTSLLQSSSSSSSSSSSLPPSLSSSFSSAHAYFESSSSSISASPPLLPCPHPSKASRKKAEGRSINNGGGGILLLPSQHRPDLSSSSSRHATVHPQRSHEENSSSSSCLSSSQSHQRRASSLSVQMGHSGVKTPGGEEEEGREKSEGLRKNSRNGKIITLPSHLNHSHDEDQRKSLTCGRSFVNRDDSILGLPSSSSSTPSSSSPSLSSSSSPSSMRPSSSDPRRAGGGEGSEGVENYYLSLCINSSFSPIHPSTAPHRLANSTSHVRLSGNASSSDSASSSSACTVLNLSSSSGGHLEEEEEKKDTEERGEEGIVVGGGEGVSLSHAGGGEGTSKPNGVLSLLFGKTRQTGRKVEVSSLFVSGDRQQEIEEKESHRGGAGGEGEKKEEQERSENEEEEGGGMIEVSRERLRSAVQTVMQSELFLDMVWRELKKQSSRNPNSQGMKREEKHEALSCHRSKNSRKKKNA